METDIIREYLIKLGVDISAAEVSKMDNMLSKTDKAITKFFKNWNHHFIVFSRAYSRFISKLVNFNLNIAQNDMYLQRWAKTLYLTADSARALNRTLSAMGLDIDDLRDVALNPELTKQYKELLRLSKSLTVGESFDYAARKFREISFEIQRIKVVFDYFKEKIVAYTWRFMESTAGKNLAGILRAFSSSEGIRLLDKAAQALGNFMGRFISGATRLLELGGVIYKELIAPIWEFLKNLGPMGNLITSLFGDIGIAILGGPFGRLLVAIEWLVELIDDYIAYEQGRPNAFGRILWGRMKSSEDIPEEELEGLSSTERGVIRGLESLDNLSDSLFDEFVLNKLDDTWLGKKLLNLEGARLKPQLEQTPLWKDLDESGREALVREAEERRGPQVNNNTPITINVNGVSDPQAAADKTVALIRSYRGVYA